MTIYKTHVTVIMPAVSEANIEKAINTINAIQWQHDVNHRIIRLLDIPKRLLTPFATTLQR